MTKRYEQLEQQLLQRRAELIERIQRITHKIQHVDGPISQDFAEQATERENEDVLGALSEASHQELSQINRTLARLEEGEYGMCATCGESIPEARLAILPNSEYCVSCAEKQDH